MTTGFFWVSYAAAWVLLLVLSGGLLVLFRFSVRTYRIQEAPLGVGDATGMSGPPLDANPPSLELQNLAGDPITVGRPAGTPQLIVFAKSTCPKCKVALELLRSFSSEHHALATTVVCGGSQQGAAECASLVRPPLKVVADVHWKGAKSWRVSHMPFGVVLDRAGVVRARGDPTSAAVLTVLSWHLENSGDETITDATAETTLGRPIAVT